MQALAPRSWPSAATCNLGPLLRCLVCFACGPLNFLPCKLGPQRLPPEILDRTKPLDGHRTPPHTWQRAGDSPGFQNRSPPWQTSTHRPTGAWQAGAVPHRCQWSDKRGQRSIRGTGNTRTVRCWDQTTSYSHRIFGARKGAVTKEIIGGGEGVLPS